MKEEYNRTMRTVLTPIALNLPLLFLKERRTYIAYTPALDLSASGSTPQKAKENFQTVLRLFIEELLEHGTLEEVLKERSFVLDDVQILH